MRFQDLSYEDQRLLQTDLGEFDKVAAEQVALIDEMYSTGFNKLAAETAEWLEKLADEEEEKEQEEEDKKLDAEGEKKASVFGAWTERGFFDGLRKLGSERYGDEWVYLMPFIGEKLAALNEEQIKSLYSDAAAGREAAKANFAAGSARLRESGADLAAMRAEKLKKFQGKGTTTKADHPKYEKGRADARAALEKSHGKGSSHHQAWEAEQKALSSMGSDMAAKPRGILGNVENLGYKMHLSGMPGVDVVKDEAGNISHKAGKMPFMGKSRQAVGKFIAHNPRAALAIGATGIAVPSAMGVNYIRQKRRERQSA